MEIPQETSKKIQELQALEQALQGILMQRQALQMEQNEVSSALSELSRSGDEVYKIVGGIMIKSDRKALIKELEEKKKVSEVRLSSMERQEKLTEEKSSSLREEIQKSLSQKK